MGRRRCPVGDFSERGAVGDLYNSIRRKHLLLQYKGQGFRRRRLPQVVVRRGLSYFSTDSPHPLQWEGLDLNSSFQSELVKQPGQWAETLGESA